MRKTIIATALLLASAPSMAAINTNSQSTMSNFDYDYIEARIGISPVTYGASISKSIHPNAHVIGKIDSEFDYDYDAAIGVGFHAPLNNWADFTGEMLFHVNDRTDRKSEDTGMEMNIGVRQWLGPQLEVGGKIGYISIGKKEDWIASAQARFHATELFSIGAEARVNDIYCDQLMFTARFKY